MLDSVTKNLSIALIVMIALVSLIGVVVLVMLATFLRKSGEYNVEYNNRQERYSNYGYSASMFRNQAYTGDEINEVYWCLTR